MRITGGQYRGRSVTPFNIPGVRPSKAMVREAVFSILGPDTCRDICVADLFSGSGIMAIESYSRGASSVYCVDSDLRSCQLIRDNLTKLGISYGNTIFHSSAAQAMNSFASLGLKFDLIFLDPPYAQPVLGLRALNLASEKGLLKTETVVVFEHQRKTELPRPNAMRIWKERNYGRTQLTFYIPDQA